MPSLSDMHFFVLSCSAPLHSITLPVNTYDLASPPFNIHDLAVQKPTGTLAYLEDFLKYLFTNISQIKILNLPNGCVIAIVIITVIAIHVWKIFCLLTFFYAIDIELCLSVLNFLARKHILYCLV